MSTSFASPASSRRRLLPSLAFVAAALSLGACGGSATFVCDPLCPTGFRCEQSGCVPEQPIAAPDLSVPGDLGAACPSSCVGATPYCNDAGVCVPCLQDQHCPAGTYCRTVGRSAACVPGCKDDSRCDGGKKCCNETCVDTSKDGNHCGACGMTCMAPNAASSCVAGRCTTGTCRSGFGDCNGNPGDGCETSLRTDAANCGACGTTCMLAHARAACAGSCYLAACDYGYEDCDSDEKTGCEVATLSDARNCGACGKLCPQASRAQIGCEIGGCVIRSCNAGSADCNRTYADGCEILTASDVSNCGACGNKCAQGQVCTNGECTCPMCVLPNAKAGCFGLQCGIASCNAGWGNCDNVTLNGCERNIDSDAAHCGACGNACGQGLVCVKGSCTCPKCNIPNAKSVCINNVCVLDSCLPGFANCDGQQGNGCEADLGFDANNCGACGKGCAQGSVCCQGACIMGGGGGGGGNLHGTQTFNPNGMVQTFTVPQCVYSLTLEAWGAQGGDSDCCQGSQVDGGLGGYAKGTLVVKPGDVLSIFVGSKGAKGGAGGYNGGGKAGQYGGGGGGASDIRTAPATLNERVLVAGGGGGGNCGCPDHGAGGAGGGLDGDKGISNQGFVPGGGGAQNAGGSPGSMSGAGSLGQGGGGGAYHEAGGGGGLYGGGGAYAAGGGGGSSYYGGLANGTTMSNQQTGDGKVVITW